MKVLLIEPPISPYDVPTGTFGLPPPYHLERIAGALLDRHDVEIIDMRIDPGLLDMLHRFQPDMVGCSGVAANNHMAMEVLKKAKQLDPDVITVMGGHHASLVPLDCLEDHVDFVVVGEGEDTIKELALIREKKLDPASIGGIAYKDKDGNKQKTGPRVLLDLDSLPAPARHVTARYRNRQAYFRASWQPTDSIISSRGCPFKCKFCGLWIMNQGRYRYRNAELIADELETITDPYVCFVDDNTLDHVKNAHRLADIIAQRGIRKTYELYGRASTIVKHPDLIEKWAKVGMKLMLIGLESANPHVLEEMHKRVTVQANEKAIQICHANGIEVVAYFIVDQKFNRDDFSRLGDYVEANELTHPVYTILSPFPGTELYDEVKSRLITDRLDLIDFFHTVLPTHLPLDAFYEEFVGLYRRAYPVEAMRQAKEQDLAMVSPKMVDRFLEMDRRMGALYSHHGQSEHTWAVEELSPQRLAGTR